MQYYSAQRRPTITFQDGSNCTIASTNVLLAAGLYTAGALGHRESEGELEYPVWNMNGIDRFARAVQALEQSCPPIFTSTIAAQIWARAMSSRASLMVVAARMLAPALWSVS